jgi:aminopeptidase
MTFEEKLKNYAELLITVGLNVQPGQIVQLSSEPIHTDFVLMLTELAYKKGAKFVQVDLADTRFARTRLLNSKEDFLTFVPDHLEMRYREMVDTVGANLRLLGSEDPDILADLNPKHVNTSRMSVREKMSYFYEEGISKSKVQWTVAGAATPGWGKKVFPELDPDEACKQLWEEIFKICRADKPNCIQLWQDHNEMLISRAKHYSELKIERLHFTGPGTDLSVYLSQQAKFRAGTDISPRGVSFEANIPTEEIFTTPNYHRTSGVVRTTRPFLINGKLIENLELEFKNGTIENFSATAGEETFREYIKTDFGSSRLGEVALVGIDSPVYQSGRVFQEILYDENAACHIAIGSAYKFCVDGGDSYSKEELEKLGCNESKAHTDMMISSEEVDVTAYAFDGGKHQIIKNGAWVPLS